MMFVVAPYAALWPLDPEITFLNHGSFGACPVQVLEAQTEIRRRIEREPVRFFVRELDPLLDAARASLGELLGADPDDLALLSNATAGVNTVLRSLEPAFGPEDEILTTDHAYNACRNALTFLCDRTGARVVVAKIPLPIRDPSEVTGRVLAAAGDNTRLALLDHVTSPTGMVLPIAEIVAGLSARGVETLIDGAHGPGMVPIDLRALDGLGATYYTGNCHKWLCTPKGAAFLWVRRDRQPAIAPLVISHGANSKRTDRSRFRLLFDWLGTGDPTAHCVIPDAIRFLSTLLPGGLPAVMAQNRALALEARETLSSALQAPPICPESMIGSLAAVALPDASPEPLAPPLFRDPLQDALLDQYGIEVPVVPWPAHPKRLLRISAQVYNRPAQYRALGEALIALTKGG